MSITEFEYQQVTHYYNIGVISKEEKDKLLNDICFILLFVDDEFYQIN